MTNFIFINGENVDLCVPQAEDFELWASWFNNQEITKYLEQGKYPNTTKQQKDFYELAVSQGRFISLVKDKVGKLLGVISLSDINYEKRTCQVAYVCPVKSSMARYPALEALAIVTQHAFDRFGMDLVWAGHSYPGLASWIQKTEIIGYKTNGVFPAEFHHGSTVNDAVRTSITKERYQRLLKFRDGNLWPGERVVTNMLVTMNDCAGLAQEVGDAIKRLHLKHDQLIDEIEMNARQ